RSEQWALPVKRSPRYSEHVTGRLDADRGGELQDGIHHGFASGSTGRIGRPNRAATFFWISMTISALRRASVRRWVSRRNCWISSATGSRLDLGPRFWGANAWSTPASRSRRQVVNNEEYKPSRR